MRSQNLSSEKDMSEENFLAKSRYHDLRKDNELNRLPETDMRFKNDSESSCRISLAPI